MNDYELHQIIQYLIWMLWNRLPLLSRFCSAQVDKFQGKIQSIPGNKPPELSDSPSGRYASSLFSVASKRACLQNVLEDLNHLQLLIKEQPSLKDLLKNASIKRNQYREIFSEFCPQNYHEVTQNLINTLIDASRLNELEQIISIYTGYCKVLNKELDMTIISAVDLSPEQRNKVIDSIKKSRPDSKFKITYEVDPTILGGLQLFFGRQFLDCSLRTRLEKLRSEISRIA